MLAAYHAMQTQQEKSVERHRVSVGDGGGVSVGDQYVMGEGFGQDGRSGWVGEK